MATANLLSPTGTASDARLAAALLSLPQPIYMTYSKVDALRV